MSSKVSCDELAVWVQKKLLRYDPPVERTPKEILREAKRVAFNASSREVRVKPEMVLRDWYGRAVRKDPLLLMYLPLVSDQSLWIESPLRPVERRQVRLRDRFFLWLARMGW